MQGIRKAAAIIAITAGAGIGVGVIGTSAALAHNVYASATCQDGVRTWAELYGADSTNRITVYIDGAVVDSRQFNDFAPVDFTPNPDKTVGHDWKVVFDQNDNGNAQSGTPDPFDFVVTGHIEACVPTSKPVAPNVTQTSACGVKDTFTAGPTEGVIYNPTSGELNPGETVNVIATPADGYVFPGGPNAQTQTFPLTGGPVEKCTLPVKPTVTQTSECGAKDTFTAGPTEGVIYTPTSGELNPGQNLAVVTATPAAGYSFDNADPTAAVTFDLTGGPVETCDTTTTTPPTTAPPTTAPPTTTPVTTAPATTTTLPATTTSEAGVEPPVTTAAPATSAPTTTAAAVAPPVPAAPSDGLPETGSSSTGTILLAGFALAAGATLIGVARRRRTHVS